MNTTVYERLLDALRDHGTVTETGGAARTKCPAHNGNSSTSLAIHPIDGSVLIYCHAGCQTADVLAVLKWQMRDLYADRKGATYDYPDGRRVHRSPNKQFRQSGNTKGASLFHADRITAETTTVYVPEGEKDVLAAESVGAVAVCSAMGAGKAHKFDWSPLRGKHVIIVADRDEPGWRHARQIAALLAGIAASATIMEAAAGKDLATHIAAGHTLDELVPLPEPEPVDGAELLDDIEGFAGRFLALPTKHHLVVLCLWAVHTWAMVAFYITPRLVLESPEFGCGKTRVLELLVLLCRSGKLIVSTSAAALYRRIDAAGDCPPTILQDEADAIWSRSAGSQAEDLRALYDSGYRRGATVDRCEGDAKNMRVREFPVFAPVALAGVEGKIPRSITSRGLVMHIRRRAPDEHLDEFRERDVLAESAPLREHIEAWAEANLDALAVARPPMPEGVRDRRAEVWEAMLAVADVAGGNWPERARAACQHFELDSGHDEKLSLGLRLLRDIKAAFGDGVDHMFSADLVATLTSDPESEWRDLWGKQLDQRRLAKELKRYGIESQQVRIGAENRKGYVVAGDTGLAQAWHRYLTSVPVRNTGNTGNIAGQSVSLPKHKRNERNIRNTSETAKTPSDQGLFENVSDVADVSLTDGNSARPHRVDTEPLFEPANDGHNGAPNHSRFTPDPPCYYCDKPVTGKQTDEHGRYAHLTCQRQAQGATA